VIKQVLKLGDFHHLILGLIFHDLPAYFDWHLVQVALLESPN